MAGAYQFGYYGVEDELQEALVCFDAASGKVLWDRRHSDFVSDIVYNRYGVGAACVDPATGSVYFQTSPGVANKVMIPMGISFGARSALDGGVYDLLSRMGVPADLVWMATWSSFMPSLQIGENRDPPGIGFLCL